MEVKRFENSFSRYDKQLNCIVFLVKMVGTSVRTFLTCYGRQNFFVATCNRVVILRPNEPYFYKLKIKHGEWNLNKFSAWIFLNYESESVIKKKSSLQVNFFRLTSLLVP